MAMVSAGKKYIKINFTTNLDRINEIIINLKPD